MKPGTNSARNLDTAEKAEEFLREIRERRRKSRRRDQRVKTPEQVVTEWVEAFKRRDAAAAATLYHRRRDEHPVRARRADVGTTSHLRRSSAHFPVATLTSIRSSRMVNGRSSNGPAVARFAASLLDTHPTAGVSP
jgi:hypothetical protein